MMARAKKDKPPSPRVRLSRQGLAAVSAYDAEELSRFPAGTEFDLVPAGKRSWPQLKLYWAILAQAVTATGRWATREKLHAALKIELGRTEPTYNIRGHIVGVQPDSIALDNMSPEDFREYFDEAVALLAEVLGYDPLREVMA